MRPWQLDPRSMPPAEVLTTLAGTGYMTPSALYEPAPIGTVQCWRSSAAGDGVVTASSASVAAAARYVAAWAHQDMPTLAAASGWLVDQVLEIRTPITPPSPVTTLAGADLLLVSGPPLPWSLDPIAGQRRCGEVPCRC